ncbi:MAG: hypothetical protein PQJ58_00190 [Spirochaetales bacterium]|nr:hypothetical protein [Spirochaetales bacterium]
MNQFKSEVKKAWSGDRDNIPPFPFEDEFPSPLKGRRKKSLLVSEPVLRCAGVVLVFGMLTVLGQIWGDQRFSTTQQNLDVKVIQESIPLLRDYFIIK